MSTRFRTERGVARYRGDTLPTRAKPRSTARSGPDRFIHPAIDNASTPIGLLIRSQFIWRRADGGWPFLRGMPRVFWNRGAKVRVAGGRQQRIRVLHCAAGEIVSESPVEQRKWCFCRAPVE